MGVKSHKNSNLGGINKHFQAKHKILKLSQYSHYRSYCMVSDQILHIYKDHQIWFVGGTQMQKTNPKWRTAAILKNKKIAKSLQWFDRF